MNNAALPQKGNPCLPVRSYGRCGWRAAPGAPVLVKGCLNSRGESQIGTLGLLSLFFLVLLRNGSPIPKWVLGMARGSLPFRRVSAAAATTHRQVEGRARLSSEKPPTQVAQQNSAPDTWWIWVRAPTSDFLMSVSELEICLELVLKCYYPSLGEH